MLQNQMDRLFVAVERRAAAKAQGLVDGGGTPRDDEDDGMGFKIEVVGDSTMRVRCAFIEQRILRYWYTSSVLGSSSEWISDTVGLRHILSITLFASR